MNPNSTEQNQAWVNISHQDNCLIVEFTKGQERWLELIAEHLPILVASGETENFDHVTEEGSVFKNCTRCRIKCFRDQVDFFFDAAQKLLRQSIQKSINHTDN